MRAFGVTVLMFFKHYFRDRSSVFWGMVFPLLLMVLIGLAFGRGETLAFAVGFVDQGGGMLGAGLRRGIGEVPVFRVSDEKDEASALAALRKGRRVLVVVVPSAPVELGEPPKNSGEGYPYERCNLWLLYTALAGGVDKVRFVCLWNGGGGDGPGGTAHMYSEVERRTGQVTWIDVRTI